MQYVELRKEMSGLYWEKTQVIYFYDLIMKQFLPS